MFRYRGGRPHGHPTPSFARRKRLPFRAAQSTEDPPFTQEFAQIFLTIRLDFLGYPSISQRRTHETAYRSRHAHHPDAAQAWLHAVARRLIPRPPPSSEPSPLPPRTLPLLATSPRKTLARNECKMADASEKPSASTRDTLTPPASRTRLTDCGRLRDGIREDFQRGHQARRPGHC